MTKSDCEDLTENNDRSDSDLRMMHRYPKQISKKKILLVIGLVCLSLYVLIPRFFGRKDVQQNFGEIGNPVWEAQIKAEGDTEAAADLKDGAEIKAMVRAETKDWPTDGVKEKDAKILVFIMIAYSNIQRRQLIRSMQIETYKKNYPIDWKFFIGKTPEHYLKQIQYEQQLYNDIVMLSDVDEDHIYASTEKYFANLKYIEENMKGYNLVCKIDGDAFLNLPVLWTEYLEPNLYNKEPTLIARVWDFTWRWQPLQPHINIAFVAMSWNMVRIINRIHAIHFKGYMIHDERRLSHYLKDDVVSYKLVALPHETSADFDPHVQDLESHSHIVMPKCAYVHELKEEDRYVTVAACFNENGLDMDKMSLLQDPLTEQAKNL